MNRTLDDHVRAVSEAIDRVRAATGHDVHLAGYSQGGMFCYQAAAFRKSAGLASIITMGRPVDLHRQLALDEDITERLIAGLRAALRGRSRASRACPACFTSTGFKLLSARKEAMQLVDFVRNLHDRSALEKREAKRLFLGGEGFVAWPGPGVSQVRRRGDRRQSHGVRRLRDRRPHRHARGSDVSDPVLRRQPRRDGPARFGARDPARRTARDEDVRGAAQGRPLRARRRLDRARP